MFFHIDPHNGLAIYDQIVRQIKFAVASGVLRSGEMVPSVRELARELTINPNTIARAYRQLQDDKVLEPRARHRLGNRAGAAERCRSERLKLIRKRLRQVLAEAKQSHLNGKSLRELIEKELRVWKRKTK